MAQQYTRKKIREVFVEMLNERPLKEITVKDIEKLLKKYEVI